MIQLKTGHHVKSSRKGANSGPLEALKSAEARAKEAKAKKRIELRLNMPPSVNQLYVKRAGGGVALRPAANKYREHVKKVISTHMAELSVFPTEDLEVCYGIDITIHMVALENPGWFERFEKDTYYAKDTKDTKHKKGDLKNKRGTRKAKTRFKRIDVDNRIKFVQDCVTNGLGIPGDEQIFEGSQRKLKSLHGEEYIIVVMYVVPRERFFPIYGRVTCPSA